MEDEHFVSMDPREREEHKGINKITNFGQKSVIFLGFI